MGMAGLFKKCWSHINFRMCLCYTCFLLYYHNTKNDRTTTCGVTTTKPSQLVMDLGQKFLTLIGSGQFFVAQAGSGLVSHLWFGLGKFPLKIPNFSIFFLLGQKKCLGVRSISTQVKDGRPLIYCKSKVCSGRVGSVPISTPNPVPL